jgi:hypothetical protein
VSAALKAGFVYFLIVFAIGFGLGTVRVLLVVPRFGETAAVALEVPVMLTASWFVCAWLTARFAVPAETSPRLIMGAAAFALLMVAELSVFVFAFGRTLGEHFAAYAGASAQLGLAAQIAFALLPLLQARVRRAT